MLICDVKIANSSALEYTAQDCFEAILANPDNPKVPDYFRLRKACLEELGRRAGRNESPAHQPGPHTNSSQAVGATPAQVSEVPPATHIVRPGN